MEKKEERLGWREEKGWPRRSYCVLNYCFSETETPNWLAACQYVNDKNISVPKGSNFHSRSNFHSTYLTMKGQFQLVCRSITLVLRGSFAYSLFSSLSLRNPQFSNLLPYHHCNTSQITGELMSQTKQQWTDNWKQAVSLQEKARETVTIIKKEGDGNLHYLIFSLLGLPLGGPCSSQLCPSPLTCALSLLLLITV